MKNRHHRWSVGRN